MRREAFVLSKTRSPAYTPYSTLGVIAPALAPDLAERIRAERAAGKSLAQIARELNGNGTPTAHGGAQWWPSTVRAVLRRGA